MTCTGCLWQLSRKSFFFFRALFFYLPASPLVALIAVFSLPRCDERCPGGAGGAGGADEHRGGDFACRKRLAPGVPLGGPLDGHESLLSLANAEDGRTEDQVVEGGRVVRHCRELLSRCNDAARRSVKRETRNSEKGQSAARPRSGTRILLRSLAFRRIAGG